MVIRLALMVPFAKSLAIRFIISALALARLFQPAFACFGPCPPSVSTYCQVIIENPIHMELRVHNATCDQSGMVSGQATVSGTVINSPNNITVEISSNFVNGRPTGRTVFDSTIRMSFVGEMFLDGHSVGYNRSPKGHVYDGEMRNGQLWAGIQTSANSTGSQTSYYLQNKIVSASEFTRFANAKFLTVQQPDSAPKSLDSTRSDKSQVALTPQTAELENPVSQMSEVSLGGSQTCLVDLPTTLYKVKADFDGRCKDGYYTGKANLVLTPRPGQSADAMSVSLRYQSGQIASPVDVSYSGTKAKYKGTFYNWSPHTGSLSEPVGNDNYRVIDFQNGQEVAERTEQREPSFGKMLGQTILSSVARAANDCLRGGCEQERLAEQARRDRKEQDRRDADTYAQQQSQIALEQQQNSIARQQENDRYAEDQTEARQRGLDAIEDAKTKQLAGLDRDGNSIQQPAPPVEVAQSDPPPVFVADTSPPATEFKVATNAPEVGGDASPQADPPVIATQPPELSLPTVVANTESTDLPPPLQSGQQLPEQSPPPLALPVQHGGQSDTLGTGGVAPSSPVQGPSRSSNTSAQLTYEQVMTPEELALNNRLPYSERATAQYSPSQIRQIKDDGRWANWLADARRLTMPVQTAQPLQTAANSGGASTPSHSTSGVATCDGSLNDSQQRIVNAYYALPAAQGTTRWTASTICSMKSRGVLEQRIAEMQAEIDRLEKERRSWWTASFSERHRVAVNDVVNSEDVKGHIEDIKQAILARLISRSFKNPEQALAKIDFFLAIKDGINRYSVQQNNTNFLNRARMANFINSQIVDALAAKLGIPFPLPISSTLNLSASASAVYVGSFIRGR